MYSVQTATDTVSFSTTTRSTLDGVPVKVTISITADDQLEHYFDRQSVGRLPSATIETLRILGVIYDGSEPEVEVDRST
ncbi:MAG: hypothetical protein H6797_03290 [Candidatus Nomurabacteria bacterium]|nr:MAG: hypothetical protein H6797_03290 [Candidatus Nomurabacteria bacterium]